jgi:ribonuclease HI
LDSFYRGDFTTSSAYRLITASTSSALSSSVSSLCWKSLWKLNLNDRLRLFLWKIAWNILPTKDRLSQLFPISDNICPLCGMAGDSLTHLFFECFFARVVWRHSFWPMDSLAFHFSSMTDWIASILSPGRSLGIPPVEHHQFQIFAAVACDILWFYRNKAFHDDLAFDARSVSAHINKIALEHFLAWHPPNQVLEEKWGPPPPNWVKLNFDTAIRDSYSVQAVVCRDSTGRILHLSTDLSSSCTPNVGEARAALLACSIAVSLSFDKFILEGDSEVVVLSLQHPNSVRDWRISSVILDCLDSISPSSSWEVRKVKRSANFCAHSVARWAAARFHSGSIPISTFPSIISSTTCGEDPFPVCLL